MTRPSNELNLEHFNNPQVSDVWQEHMVVYHIVLQVNDNDLIVIAEKDYSVTRSQTFDYINAKEITKEEHKKLITYSGNTDITQPTSFVADVLVNSVKAKAIVEEWKKDYHGKYITYKERQERLAKEKKQDEELGTGFGFNNSKLQGGLTRGTMAVISSPNIDSLYDRCGYRIVKSMRDIEMKHDIDAIAQFEYKGYQIAFSTIKQTDKETPRLVSIWSGEKRDNFINSVETAEEAIKFVDELINQLS